MLRDINQFFEFIKSDRGGKIIRNRIIIITLVIIAALFFNRYVLSQYMSDDLQIDLTRSKLLFQTGKSPYDGDIQNYLRNLAKEEKWVVDEEIFKFDLPLFHVLIYLPFSLIPNYLWANSLFITVNLICVIMTMNMLLNLLEWDPKVVERIGIYLLSIGVFFIQKNILSGDLSILQLTMIVAVLFYEERKKYIAAGILLGLSFFNPFSMLLTVCVLLVIIISRSEYSILIWSIITIGLLSIFTIIFDKNWIIGWLKNLFLIPMRFPFINYKIVFQLKYGIDVERLIIILPILLTSWVVLEVIRMPKESPGEALWLLSFSGVLNYYVMVHTSMYASVLFFPVLILTISVWWKRINNLGRLVLYILLIGISVGIIIFELIYPMVIYQRIELLFVLITIFFLVNLYWSRLWIISPYLIGDSNKKNNS